MRAFRREQHDDDHQDDNGQVVGHHRLDALTVADVVIVQVVEAGRVAENLGGDLPARGGPHIPLDVVERHRPEKQDMDPGTFEDADLTVLRQARKILQALGKLDKTQHGDAGLVDELVERRVDLFDVYERLEVGGERQIVDLEQLLQHGLLLLAHGARGKVGRRLEQVVRGEDGARVAEQTEHVGGVGEQLARRALRGQGLLRSARGGRGVAETVGGGRRGPGGGRLCVNIITSVRLLLTLTPVGLHLHHPPLSLLVS